MLNLLFIFYFHFLFFKVFQLIKLIYLQIAAIIHISIFDYYIFFHALDKFLRSIIDKISANN